MMADQRKSCVGDLRYICTCEGLIYDSNNSGPGIYSYRVAHNTFFKHGSRSASIEAGNYYLPADGLEYYLLDTRQSRRDRVYNGMARDRLCGFISPTMW